MNTTAQSRRTFLVGSAAVGATALMSGCVASPSTSEKGAVGGAVTLQSNPSYWSGSSQPPDGTASRIADSFTTRGVDPAP
ncbi:twin-arginine translocation signal domain-containing protein [Streptomyces sp. NBC_01320]|uniref:twin-arginine translocation signal domain-containing protein n=1 Tax=Streptomyces sp. NBC_01320 TaxID=2903824 RepID=UPI002E11D2F6|nr:twin-arginine translocation signal domain-containing protein [Streptomyces sp. NBC_01320]